jgi:single-stranded-DNA-specific exonuclease
MKWVLTEADKGAVADLADQAGLPLLIATLMVNRGIIDPVDARSFLSCDLATLSDPGIFDQMDKAVARIRAAITKG